MLKKAKKADLKFGSDYLLDFWFNAFYFLNHYRCLVLNNLLLEKESNASTEVNYTNRLYNIQGQGVVSTQESDPWLTSRPPSSPLYAKKYTSPKSEFRNHPLCMPRFEDFSFKKFHAVSRSISNRNKYQNKINIICCYLNFTSWNYDNHT